MLRRVALAIIFLGVYQAIVSLKVLPVGQGIGVKQINLITAYSWKSRTTPPAIAIVGSSRSGWMNADYFTSDVADLAMHGNGAATGLEILRRSPRVPPAIAVEISDASVIAPVDSEVVSCALSKQPDLFAPFGYESRPINVAIGAICPLRTPPQYLESTLARMREARKAGFGKHVHNDSIVKLVAGASRIKNQLSALEARGARIYLFEEPMDRIVSESQVQVDVRRIFKAEFPPQRYHWIETPEYDWKTADLIHLNGESNKRFAAALEGQVQRAELASRADSRSELR